MSALACVQPLEPFAVARRNFEGIVQYLDSKEAGEMTHGNLERALEKKGRDLLRDLFQAHLDTRAPGQATAAVSAADGTDRPRIRLQQRLLETVFGTVELRRCGYASEGTSSLHPLDAELNLPPERYSHELRRRVAEEAAKTSFDEVVASITRNTGGEIPKRQVEELAERAAQDFDAFYQKRHAQPDAQEQTGSVLVLRQMARKKRVALTIVVDFIHVTEYLWAAGRAFHPESSLELEKWVQQRLLEILRGNAGQVAGGMRRSATLRSLARAERKPVDACARYLLTYGPYLKYNRYLAQGLPIATGVIEGACRHLVKDRMDVTGARWSLAGAEAVLRLRALRSSKDFDEYWSFHENREYQRNHQTLYADGIVPATTAPRREGSRTRPQLKILN